MTNLHVLYEQDAVIHSTLQKEACHDITCPTDIEHYNPSKDVYNCICMQKQGWNNIDRLSDIELHEPSFSNVNYFWIKGDFYIKDKPEQYQGALLENVQGRDVIYINNRLVGIKNVDRYSHFQRPSHYQIPSGVLKKGKNTVLMRLEICTTANKGVSPYLFIQPQPDYKETKSWYLFIHQQTGTIFFCILCAIFIYSLTQVVVHNNKMIHIASLFSLLYYLILVLFVFIPFTYLNATYVFRFFNSINYAYAIIFIIYFQALYGIMLSRVNRIFVPLIIIFAALSSVAHMYTQPMSYGFLYMTTIIPCYCFMVYTLLKLNRLKPDTKKFLFLFCLMVVFITNTVIITISFITEVSFGPGYAGNYLYVPTLLILSLFGIAQSALAKRKSRIHLEQLYSQFLKQENIQLDSITITDSSEEKLGQIISFINENYTENLSRKDLAATINMNPSHFSTLFNSYTGKKIQEYINLLRINNATRLIKETDKKIIDIAFSVGFENLSTFIRVFKKETGKTPRDYREDYTMQSGTGICTLESTAE